MSSTSTACVIGGGIAGPSIAIALHKAGIEATVFEARQEGADGRGIMLPLATNLRDHDSVVTAFAAFETARRPRVEKIFRAATRINSCKAHARSGGCCATPRCPRCRGSPPTPRPLARSMNTTSNGREASRSWATGSRPAGKK